MKYQTYMLLVVFHMFYELFIDGMYRFIYTVAVSAIKAELTCTRQTKQFSMTN